MIYVITYHKNDESQTLEWIVPTGWNTAAIAQAFAERYPAATLLGMEPKP